MFACGMMTRESLGPKVKSVKDMGYEVLLVSQFTLFGSVKRLFCSPFLIYRKAETGLSSIELPLCFLVVIRSGSR